MKKLMHILLISLFVCFGAFAKTLKQKEVELKKIYEAGGISETEYNKAQEFLENSKQKTKEKKLKKSFDLTTNKESKKFKAKSIYKKYKDKRDKDKKEITLKKIEELGPLIKFDKSYYTDSMYKKFGKGCYSFKCQGQDAGKFLAKAFGKSKEWGQKNPGQMIKAMSMFEVFYASKLWYARKSIERYKANDYKSDYFFKRKDEAEIRSLLGMNKGRKNMREALGMNLETPTKEAIKKFWLLGEFLDLGTVVNNKKLDKDLKERKELLEAYKSQITKLKNKLKDDLEKEEEENETSVE